MTALVLDSGALIAIDRNERSTVALLLAARTAGLPLRTNANVVAQVWRDPRGRQVELGRFLRSVEIRSVDGAIGRRAGELLAQAATTDVVDATVALLASTGDQVLTSDPGDISHLIGVLGRAVEVVGC